nr:MAG TPA: hypothetical protein [Caudoviricetes sp.]
MCFPHFRFLSGRVSTPQSQKGHKNSPAPN